MGHSNWNYSGKASDSPSSTQSSGQNSFENQEKSTFQFIMAGIGSESANLSDFALSIRVVLK